MRHINGAGVRPLGPQMMDSVGEVGQQGGLDFKETIL